MIGDLKESEASHMLHLSTSHVNRLILIGDGLPSEVSAELHGLQGIENQIVLVSLHSQTIHLLAEGSIMVFLGEADRCSVICILGNGVGATNGLQSWIRMEEGNLRVLRVGVEDQWWSNCTCCCLLVKKCNT